ncbi:MAG: GntR family transcriptional regulator [Chloroflexota bacterium]|nr:GntR family transcriptional regulator [Chloroflexota bacterium]
MIGQQLREPISPIDRSSPLPLYHRVCEAIRRNIEDGRFPPGSQLPTEEELCAALGVSRTTIREALRALAQRGLIERRQGRGTFVAAPKIGEVLPSVSSFSAEMEARGHSVRSNVLDVVSVSPPGRVRDSLHLPLGTEVLRVVRQRFVDGKPIVVSTSYLAASLSPGEDFGGSLYALLGCRLGLAIASGTATVEAGLADEYEAGLLEVPSGAAVLKISWLGLTAAGAPIEYSEATYRGDSYRYIIRLERRS